MTLEPIDIGEILGPGRRALVAKETLPTQSSHLQSEEVSLDPIRPSFLEFNSVDAVEDIDPDRLHTDLEDQSGNRELFGWSSMLRRAEFRQGLEDSVGVLKRRTNPDIQILGGADVPLQGERVRPDHQKFHFSGEKRRQQISEVLVDRSQRADPFWSTQDIGPSEG